MSQTLRLILFLGTGLTLFSAVHFYLYRRLIHDTTRDARWRAVGAVLAVVLIGFMLVARMRFVRNALPDTLSAPVSFLAFSWMGLVIFLFTTFVVIDLVLVSRWALRKLKARAASHRQPEPQSPERRMFLQRVTAGGALATSGALVGYGAFRAFHEPEVSEVTVKLPRLPKSLDGLTIVQLTDIHVGSIIGRKFTDEMVARCNALKPDLVAVTGDLVDGSVEVIGPSVAALMNLKTRFGTYFVTGNHEYYSGDVEWTEALTKMGVEVLRNRRVEIGDAGGKLDLLGVDDWSGRGARGGYDLNRAMEGRDPERAAVLLSHQPRNFANVVKRGIGLQLSGHTHGGQLFPGTVLISLIWEYPRGLYREGDGHLYVSRGTGFWGPPMRVGSPPEIVKLTLTA